MTPAQAKAAQETPLRPGEVRIKGFDAFFIHSQPAAKNKGYQAVTVGYAPSERHMIMRACSNFLRSGNQDYLLVQGEEAHKVEIWRPKNTIK